MMFFKYCAVCRFVGHVLFKREFCTISSLQLSAVAFCKTSSAEGGSSPLNVQTVALKPQHGKLIHSGLQASGVTLVQVKL